MENLQQQLVDAESTQKRAENSKKKLQQEVGMQEVHTVLTQKMDFFAD